MQMGKLAFTNAWCLSIANGHSPVFIKSFFFLYDYDRGEANIFLNFSRIFSIYRRCQPGTGDGVFARGIGKFAFK